MLSVFTASGLRVLSTNPKRGMPRKIVPVPGIPPHEWHNHQPSSGEEEVKQDNMAPHENSVNIKTETIDPQEPGLAESQKPHGPKGGLKQWQTTTDDPTRLHRLMRDGYGEPLRKSAPIVQPALC